MTSFLIALIIFGAVFSTSLFVSIHLRDKREKRKNKPIDPHLEQAVGWKIKHEIFCENCGLQMSRAMIENTERVDFYICMQCGTRFYKGKYYKSHIWAAERMKKEWKGKGKN